MRKKYLQSELGIREEYWDGNWNSTSIERALEFVEISPLKPIFDVYFPREGKILEGGCGLGQYVIYYKRKGYDIEGVEFAQETLKRVKQFSKEVLIKKGDVLNLSYPADYFDVYYSGGVVEHFEQGPHQALKEAYRVLKKEGVLIITVPYCNLYRRIQSFISYMLGRNTSSGNVDFDGKKTRHVWVRSHQITPSPFKGFSFHQYEYTRKEFSQILKEQGFKLIKSHGTSIIWGLQDHSFLRKIILKITKKSTENGSFVESSPVPGAIQKASSFKKKVKLLLKKILISEIRAGWIETVIVSILQFTSANMVLFICKKKSLE